MFIRFLLEFYQNKNAWAFKWKSNPQLNGMVTPNFWNNTPKIFIAPKKMETTPKSWNHAPN